MITDAERDWLARPTLLPPELRQIEGTRWWEFAEIYQVSLPPPLFPLRLVIPPGWRYDRSSIPAVVPSWVIGKDHLGCLAPAAHDAGYRCRGVFLPPPKSEHIVQPWLESESGPVGLHVTRRTVDQWFKMFLLRQRIKPWRAGAAYRAVSWYWTLREALGLSRAW